MTPCLCGCGRPARVRGLGKTCYMALQRQVSLGLASWEQLEREGKCLAALSSREKSARALGYLSKRVPARRRGE